MEMTDVRDPQTSLGAVLVTGGAGFIGCAISRLLAPRSERYVVLDNLHPQVHPEPVRPERLDPKAQLVVGDVTNSQAWADILRTCRPDVVIHLAAETGTGQSLSEATRHASINVVGTTVMLDALHSYSVAPKHLVLASSRAVYGEGRWRRADGSTYYPGQRTHAQLESELWDFPASEPLPSVASLTMPAPTSVYGATKLAQEHILRAWCGAHDVPLSVLRFQNVYGPGQSMTNAYTGIVVLFAQIAKRGEAIPLYEDGEMSRDFVFIEDAAAAVAACVESVPDDPARCFDVGSGRRTTVRQLAQELSYVYNSKPPVVTGRFRDGDVRHAWCSTRITEEALGWRPLRSLGEGLRELTGWIDSDGAV